jgi:hypothetical protein
VVETSVDGGQHSFIIGAGWVPETDRAIAAMGSWLRSTLKVETDQ